MSPNPGATLAAEAAVRGIVKMTLGTFHDPVLLDRKNTIINYSRGVKSICHFFLRFGSPVSSPLINPAGRA
jgi:hypothetical protein